MPLDFWQRPQAPRSSKNLTTSFVAPGFTHQLGNALGSASDSVTTLANIYSQAVQQSQLLSYLDGFKALALLFLALLRFLLLVKPGKGGAAAAPAH
jgi:hypothetical protein